MIPRGRVATYGQIAGLLGHPRHARHVGSALRQTPNQLEIPWYRVLRANGELAFEAGTESYHVQMARLQQEEVEFNQNGRVNLKRFGWQP